MQVVPKWMMIFPASFKMILLVEHKVFCSHRFRLIIVCLCLLSQVSVPRGENQPENIFNDRSPNRMASNLHEIFVGLFVKCTLLVSMACENLGVQLAFNLFYCQQLCMSCSQQKSLSILD